MKFLQPAMTPAQRLDWLDMAKGIGMILVVYGHSYGPSNYYVYLIYICRFFLFFPAFFLTASRNSEPIYIKNSQAYISPLQGGTLLS